MSHTYRNPSLWFIIAGLLALCCGIFFGILGSLQYLFPEFLKELLPFYKSRPLHVSLVIAWIFLGAIGSIYFYLPTVFPHITLSNKLIKIHFIIFIITGLGILLAYTMGFFGGREYFEFSPIFSLLIAVSWSIFLYNFFKNVKFNFGHYPIYVWMWATGLIFFLFTFIENNLWLIPYFRNNIIRDVTVQWKSLGSMVGSWNMLIYGTSFYLMEKIKNDPSTAHAKKTFFFYFLSLTNLMFNWGHHTYIVPASPIIKNVAFFISMTELLILFNILLQWKHSLSDAQKYAHNFSYRMLFAAEVWVLLNLILAITISIPAINLYTHGTHITVAHAMGTTIGINTTLLLASCFFIGNLDYTSKSIRWFRIGYWIFNISLLCFWVALIGAGVTKAFASNHPYQINDFFSLMKKLQPFFQVFSVCGIGVFIGLLILVIPLLKRLSYRYQAKQ